MAITEEDIKNKSIGEILKVLRNLSLGAGIRITVIIVGIGGVIYNLGYKIGFSDGFNKGKVEVVTSNRAHSLQGLTSEHSALLREIWTYQKANKLDKVIIDGEGFVFDETRGEKTKINLAEKALGARGFPFNFQKLIISMPAPFLRLIPEVRWGSVYVVHVPEEAGKILDEN